MLGKRPWFHLKLIALALLTFDLWGLASIGFMGPDPGLWAVAQTVGIVGVTALVLFLVPAGPAERTVTRLALGGAVFPLALAGLALFWGMISSFFWWMVGG